MTEPTQRETPRDEPHRCERDGSPLDGDWWACFDGTLYGPCEDPGCGGVCEMAGDCECRCHGEGEPERIEGAWRG